MGENVSDLVTLKIAIKSPYVKITIKLPSDTYLSQVTEIIVDLVAPKQLQFHLVSFVFAL